MCVYMCLCVCMCMHVAVAMQSVLRYIAPTTWPVTSLVWDSVRGSPHCGPGLPIVARVEPQFCCNTCVCIHVQLYIYRSVCACACCCCLAVGIEVYRPHDVAGNQLSLGFHARIASWRAWPASRSKGSTSVLLRNMCVCMCAIVRI